MVVFTCNHCGESLQKPKVEKHYQFTCRTVKNLTCVDCFKDFRNEEYVIHNKCITEEERYAAKGSIPNGIVKKGEVKQESWVEMIKSILDKEKNMMPSHRNLLNSIAAFSNVPRKRAKFINFVKSSSGGRANMKDVEAVWDIIEKYKASQSTNGQAENGTKRKTENGDNATNGKNDFFVKAEDSQNGDETEEAPKPKKSKKKNIQQETEEAPNDNEENKAPKVKKTKKKNVVVADDANTTEETTNVKKYKKKKLEENGDESNNGEPKTKKKKSNEASKENAENVFDYQTTILSILQEKPSISLKKLEKKFIKLYTDQQGEILDLEKVSKKFNKRLKKLDNVTITNNTVNYVNE